MDNFVCRNGETMAPQKSYVHSKGRKEIYVKEEGKGEKYR
jgi:hypothetical protein